MKLAIRFLTTLAAAMAAAPAWGGACPMGMPCPMPSGAGRAAPLLIALAVGYGVLVLARRETKPLNRIGKVVGWFIMVVSFVGLLCSAASCLRRMCPSSAGGCPMGGGAKSACMMPPLDDAQESPDTDPGQ